MWINIKTLFLIIYRFIATTILWVAIALPMLAYSLAAYYILDIYLTDNVEFWFVFVTCLVIGGIAVSGFYSQTLFMFDNLRWWHYFDFIPNYFMDVREEIVCSEEHKIKQKQQNGDITEL